MLSNVEPGGREPGDESSDMFEIPEQLEHFSHSSLDLFVTD